MIELRTGDLYMCISRKFLNFLSNTLSLLHSPRLDVGNGTAIKSNSIVIYLSISTVSIIIIKLCQAAIKLLLVFFFRKIIPAIIYSELNSTFVFVSNYPLKIVKLMF